MARHARFMAKENPRSPAITAERQKPDLKNGDDVYQVHSYPSARIQNSNQTACPNGMSEDRCRHTNQ